MYSSLVQHDRMKLMSHETRGHPRRRDRGCLRCSLIRCRFADLAAAGSERLEAYLFGLMSIPCDDNLTTHVSGAVAAGCAQSGFEFPLKLGGLRERRRHISEFATHWEITTAVFSGLRGPYLFKS